MRKTARFYVANAIEENLTDNPSNMLAFHKPIPLTPEKAMNEKPKEITGEDF